MLNNMLILSTKIRYSITIGNTSGGTVSISPQGKQYAGTVITVTCLPNSTYQFKSISIVKQNGSTVSYTTISGGSKFSFVMPSSNVTINVVYSVSLKANGGSIHASKTSGIRAGETITLTLTPNAYYTFSKLSSSPSVSFGGSGNTRTFTMPSSNITITATFLANYTHIISSSSYKEGSRTWNGYINSANSPSGRQLGSVSPTTFGGYTLTGIYSITYRDSSSINDQYVLFTQKPPYSRMRITDLESGHTAILYGRHSYGYGNSKDDVDNDWAFVFGQNAHIKLEFLD